jgi:hypothetical protein
MVTPGGVPTVIIFRVEHNRHRLHRLQVSVCETGFERGRGLLLRRRPGADCAWLLPGRRAVHTIGLYYPIDVLKPCRIVRERRASQVWQLCAGGAAHWGWLEGDQVRPC